MNETMRTGQPAIVPTKLPVFEHRSQLVADSRDVAAMLDRSHGHLVRSIRTYCGYLSQSKIGTVEFFIPSTYKDEKGEERPNFLLTEMGCDMVANKTTGERGTTFTAQYVKAFHAMRTKLARLRELRAIGRPIRRSLTDALRDSGEVKRMHGHAYEVYTNLAYRLAIGKSARQLRKERGVDTEANAIDLLTASELELYQHKEAVITVLLDAGLSYGTIKATLAGVEPQVRV